MYSGLPDTIINRSMIQQGENVRYTIEPDIGKRIVLWAANIDYYSYPQEKRSRLMNLEKTVQSYVQQGLQRF